MNIQEAFYEQKFENAFLRTKGDDFQTFFERLMGLAYKEDFIPCRPWGNIGDKKNDGFLKSEKRLFQVYAPNQMKASEAIKKINNDFSGAKSFWGVYFDKWSFVHNAFDGLSPHVIKIILDFELTNPKIKIDTWSLEELRIIFQKLSISDKESWFGFAPSNETKLNLGFNDLKVVLERIAALPIPENSVIKDVPMGKIEANALSESVELLLKEGMIKSNLVNDFFRQWHNELYGEQIAESFREEYKRLKNVERLSPNQIFGELQLWAGGENRGTPEHELAVLAVLAYFFERCDIFEEPKEKIL